MFNIIFKMLSQHLMISHDLMIFNRIKTACQLTNLIFFCLFLSNRPLCVCVYGWMCISIKIPHTLIHIHTQADGKGTSKKILGL